MMHGLASKAYNHLPIFFQNLYMGIESKKGKKNRYGNIYTSLLDELSAENGHACREDVQQKELRSLLKHAIEKSHFYQKFYQGIEMESVQTLADLPMLPVVEREYVHQYINKMHTVEDSHAVVFQSIDQQGIPLKFLFTGEDIQKRNAFMDLFKMQHGAIAREMKQAIFTSRPFVPKTQQKKVFWRDNLPEKIRFYSNYHCTRGNAEPYIQNLNEFQPDFINGTSAILYKLAIFLNQAQEKLEFTPKAVFLEGRIIEPAQKEEIEKAFNCPVRNHFAPSHEFPMLSECTEGKLHAHPRAGVIEFASDGEMIVTNFMSYGTPIIRCRTGVYAEMKKAMASCPCGSAQPVIEFRKEADSSYLHTVENAVVKVPQLDETGKEFSESIKKMQFIQNRKEMVDVFIEAEETYTNELSEDIHDNLQSVFGHDMKFNIRVVEEMPYGSGQDFELIVNNLTT